MSEYADEFTDLLGAYALDAVEPDERLRIEDHLRTCAFCSAEVAEHREVAAFLSQSGADAPAGIWGRIAAELSPPAPPLRLSITRDDEGSTGSPPAAPVVAAPAAPANVVSLAERRTLRVRIGAVVVAAAAVIVAVLGAGALGRATAPDDAPSSEVALPNGPSALQVKLTAEGSRKMGAQAVVTTSGQGYLVSHDLPDPGTDELYQLWGRVDGVVLSLGTFGADTEVVNFQLDPSRLDDVDLFAITKERAPGVLASANPPVMAGTVA